MNRNILPLKGTKKIPKRENLPLLRGMFVSPEPARRQKHTQHHASHSFIHEEGLFLTAAEGIYLGE